MMTVYAILAAVVVLGGAATAVVLYIKKAAATAASLKADDAARASDDQRVAQMEQAAADARAERAKEFDAKVAAVHSAADAAELLHEVGHHTDSPAAVPDPRPVPGA